MMHVHLEKVDAQKILWYSCQNELAKITTMVARGKKILNLILSE